MTNSFSAMLRSILNAFSRDFLPALRAFWAFLKACFKKGKKKRRPRPSCVPVNHPSLKRPDPTIYDQYYLMSLGLAVSWQNPDVTILLGGVPVASAYDLLPSTTYTIQATIYNASTEGVVYNMPVLFSYLSFGMGTQSNPIPGVSPTVSLGVKGTPQGIAVAEMPWTTPTTPGHYCIQVSFAWIDDVNPFNNLGQDNTQVVQAASPAPIEFQLRNSGKTRGPFRFEADTFQIPPQPTCPDTSTKGKANPKGGVSAPTRARNSRAAHPLPPGWTIDFSPANPTLDPDEEITITGNITPPDTFHGTQAVNIDAFNGAALAGGVTITVNRA
jgi:hypothetical protein